MAFHGSSSSSDSRLAYQVFLSFRGEDTRKAFTAHLYAALLRNGIHTFMDDKLRSGEEISPALIKAIEGSHISIIVFSKNYASSRWCLDELTKILDCKKTWGQQVLPVFYDVDPSEVRNQTNCVGEAFAKLEKRFKDNIMKVEEWKTSLTKVANLSGMHLGNRIETEFIREIIGWVNSILVKKTQFQVAQHLVGIESRVQDVKSLLDMEKNESTCMVGIFGIGGIGKTTLTKAIYNSIASQFESSCFLENIRETSKQKGLIDLQNKLLSTILGDSSLIVDNVIQGITLIKQRLHLIRILLVLDDVDHSDQLEKIVEKGDWFGLGSRIIITTRNKHLLTKHQVHPYEMKELGHDEALQLFSWHAFNAQEPNDDYEKVTKAVVHYARGLPLALAKLGSALKGRDILYWKSKLDEYKIIPHNDIQKNLRISFDGLDENTKNIFLDIACFFEGENAEFVTKILDSTHGLPSCSGIEELTDRCLVNVEYVTKILDSTHGFHSYSGIEELMDGCLVTQSYNKLLKMHTLIQEMGREIVRQESINEPGKRSRLWSSEDVRDVLERNSGTNKVEGMLIRLPKPDLIHLTPEAFEKMKRLKIFINSNARFSKEPSFISNELRLLVWPNYPGESLPSNFCGKNLLALSMPRSQLKDLEGVQNFQNMTIMNFSHCKFLRKIPDVSRIPNLQKLILKGCTNLVEVHHSVGSHDKLVILRLDGCSNLMSFSRSLKMRSLKFLWLYGCLKLKNFPEIQCRMECLEKIDFRETAIKELPSSIGYLVGIKTLNLSTCTKLTNLPNSIHKLQHLEVLNIGGTSRRDNRYRNAYRLNIVGCSKVDEFFKEAEDMRHSMPAVVSMEESATSSMPELLQLSPLTNTSNSNDGCSSMLFSKLQMLGFENCDLSESNIFRTFDWISTLTLLYIEGSDIVTLPPCIRSFVRLKRLYLWKCKQLREILGLPPNVKIVMAYKCVSLAIFLEEGRKSQLFNTPEALFQVGTIFPALILGNNVLAESDFLIQRDCPSSLRCLDLSGSAIVSLPVWLNRFARLKYLDLGGCKQLREIPELPPTLREIDLSDCHGLHEADMQIRLMSEGHLKDHEFACIFVGNKIPDWFNHCKEVSNANSCEIDIDEPVHLDLENTRFAFSAVFGTNDVQVELILRICVEVINNGQQIIYREFDFTHNSTRSNNVWLNYHVSYRYQLKTDNLRVKFACMDRPVESEYDNFKLSKSLFFKSCGFHLEHICEEKAEI